MYMGLAVWVLNSLLKVDCVYFVCVANNCYCNSYYIYS